MLYWVVVGGVVVVGVGVGEVGEVTVDGGASAEVEVDEAEVGSWACVVVVDMSERWSQDR